MVLVVLFFVAFADSCSVRDTERKAAIMQFSSDCQAQQKSSFLNQDGDQRYTEMKTRNFSEFHLHSATSVYISAVCLKCICTVLLFLEVVLKDWL